MGMNNPGMGAGMGNRAPLNRPNLMPNQPVRFVNFHKFLVRIGQNKTSHLNNKVLYRSFQSQSFEKCFQRYFLHFFASEIN